VLVATATGRAPGTTGREVRASGEEGTKKIRSGLKGVQPAPSRGSP
jgi:hypothetical protein